MTPPKTLRGGTPRHQLTTQERQKGATTTNQKKREQRETARTHAEEQLGEHVDRAVQRLAEVLESTDERVVVQAAKEILDRVIGRPVQSVSGDADRSVSIVIEEIQAEPLAANGSGG